MGRSRTTASAKVRACRGEYTFQFVTTGDDNDTDCYHEDFEFTVAAPVVQ